MLARVAEARLGLLIAILMLIPGYKWIKAEIGGFINFVFSRILRSLYYLSTSYKLQICVSVTLVLKICVSRLS
jgi:hypothetical protein